MRLNEQEETRLAERERTYWWHIAKRNFLRAILRRHSVPSNRNAWILDVGGAGGETKELFDPEDHFVVIEPALTAPLLQSRVGLRLVARAEALPFRKNQFDLVIAADVLEHIEKDDSASEEIRRIVRGGGHFLATVPAHPLLFSSHDEALGHFRRYSKKAFTDLFTRSGWSIQFTSLIFAALLPGIILRRFLSPKGSPQPESSYVDVPSWLNAILVAWFLIEAAWLHFSKWPFGTSLALLAKKPNS